MIHTYSGHENKVKTNLEKAIHSAGLEDQFGQILVATEDFAEMKDGKRTISKRKTFPSYVLVEMDLDDDTRNLVQNVPGVTRFVGSGQAPIAAQGERSAAHPRPDGGDEDEAGRRPCRSASASTSRSSTDRSPTSPASSTR